MFPSGCHGNQVSIATQYEADAYCTNKPPYQIRTQYDLRQSVYWHITVVAMVTFSP